MPYHLEVSPLSWGKWLWQRKGTLGLGLLAALAFLWMVIQVTGFGGPPEEWEPEKF